MAPLYVKSYIITIENRLKRKDLSEIPEYGVNIKV